MATVYSPDEQKRSRFHKIFEVYNQLFYYIIILFIFNIILLFLPLTKYFSFEFSLCNSVLIVFLSGIFIIKFLKSEDSLSSKHEGIWYNLFPGIAAFIFIPLLIGIINALLSVGCSLTEGLFFYLIIAVPAVIVGLSLGMLSSLLVKKFKLILFLLIYFLLLFSPLLEIYLNPQVYFYNPVIAYFPGTIYDEALSINTRMVVYRLLNLIYFGIIFILAYRSYFKIGSLTKKSALFFLIPFGAAFIYFSPTFGYSTTLTRLQEKLNKEIETPHFIIRYSPGIDEKFIKSLALHHEYFYEELKNYLKCEPKEKIKSFIFGNSQDKKEFIGSANADIAKPWLYQIYTVSGNYEETLKHEIAHCFSAEFGEGLFKLADNFNPSLIEGIASAADPLFDENYVDYAAAVAYKNGYRINLENLFGYFSFFGNVSSLSYVYAGSFTKFLINSYGIQKYKRLYKNLDFREVYGISLELLSRQFFGYLRKINVEGTRNQAKYYYGRKSIFYKTCPRYAANESDKGWAKFEQGNYHEAEIIFSDLLKITNDYSALNGLASSLWEENKKAESIDLLKSRLEEYKNSSYYYLIELKLGDQFAQQRMYKDADSIYSQLEKQNPSRRFYYLTSVRLNLVPHLFPENNIDKEDKLLSGFFSKNIENKYSVMKEINSVRYIYNSFPVLIDLARILKTDYNEFLNLFTKTPKVDNYSSAYGIYKLSGYMIENLDFEKARRMAALTLRFKDDRTWEDRFIFQSNYKKAEWFFSNAQNLLNQFKSN
ncbi:MAG: tetratricopeptide repeat protein [Ignavibacteria bacterium]